MVFQFRTKNARERTQIPKGCHFLAHPVYFTDYVQRLLLDSISITNETD